MYRYSETRYNQSLVIMGGLRVGTLHDFRNSEHKRGIADPQEGKKQVTQHIEHMRVSGSDDENAQLVRQFGEGQLNFGEGVTLRNCNFNRNFDIPDCFVFCTSKECSSLVMAEFDGADSCIKITDEDKFYEIMTHTLNGLTSVVFRGIHDVVYQDRKEKWNGQNWGHHPALIKEPTFSKQRERRAIWQPHFNQKIQPLILGNYRLGVLCKETPVGP